MNRDASVVCSVLQPLWMAGNQGALESATRRPELWQSRSSREI